MNEVKQKEFKDHEHALTLSTIAFSSARTRRFTALPTKKGGIMSPLVATTEQLARTFAQMEGS